MDPLDFSPLAGVAAAARLAVHDAAAVPDVLQISCGVAEAVVAGKPDSEECPRGHHVKTMHTRFTRALDDGARRHLLVTGSVGMV